ncbi:pilin [Patescibacteria group bacterium]|nr:pilin [Patescibacteria group bacterium]
MNFWRYAQYTFVFIAIAGMSSIANVALAECEDDAYEAKDACDIEASIFYNDCLDAGTSLSTCTWMKEMNLTECLETFTADLAACEEAVAEEVIAEAAATAELPATNLTEIPSQAKAASVSSISIAYDDIMSQGLIFAGICTSKNADCACRDNGDCTLDDVLQLLVNISVFLLGLIGSAVLLMFMYGGFLWLTSQGKPEAIKNGTQTMVNAVIGLIIVFGAYAAITIVISVIKTGELPSSDNTVEQILEKSPEGGSATEGITGASKIINTTTE